MALVADWLHGHGRLRNARPGQPDGYVISDCASGRLAVARRESRLPKVIG
jgi:hypothetical protein